MKVILSDLSTLPNLLSDLQPSLTSQLENPPEPPGNSLASIFHRLHLKPILISYIIRLHIKPAIKKLNMAR